MFLLNPNPVSKGEPINFGGVINFSQSKISLVNINGAIIGNIVLDKNNNWIVPQNIASGTYVIKLEYANKVKSSLILIQ